MAIVHGLTTAHRSMRDAHPDQRIRWPLGAIISIRPPHWAQDRGLGSHERARSWGGVR